MTLGAEGFDCHPHILTSPKSRNRSIQLHVKPSNIELVRSKDEMNLFLCCDDIYRFSFPKRRWIPHSILSFPVKQHSLIALQALGSMMASDSSELHCEGQVHQTESKWHRENLLYIFPELFLYKNNTKFSKIFEILKRMQIFEFLF